MICCNAFANTCCQGGDFNDQMAADGVEYVSNQTPKRGVLKIRDFADEVKAAGGPASAPGAEPNKGFLELLDSRFPELKIYRSGRIQSSPGVEEIEGSPTEYFRTVGAIIALLAAYLTCQGDPAGLELVSAGERGPMSVDKVPGKFINMGSKPEEYKQFCEEFGKGMETDDDWWSMLVFLVVHDVGKSDEFRNRVNATLPKDKRSDDHDRALANALKDPDLMDSLLPSVRRLGVERQQRIAAGFDTNFQLPQLGQGEIAVCSLSGLLSLGKDRVRDGTLRNYLYHSIFDIAGATANEKFIFPLALVPVYLGFSGSMNALINKLDKDGKPDEATLYFDFLYTNFKKSYPEYEESVFRVLCDSKMFRDEVGLVVLRIMALTRNTHKNPAAVLGHLLTSYQCLANEMAGNVTGPQIMLYYGPDLLRMGLGEDLTDESGDNMHQALGALETLYRLAREKLRDCTAHHFELNVYPAVSAIKDAGKSWRGGSQLRELCNGVTIIPNDLLTEGIIQLRKETPSDK